MTLSFHNCTLFQIRDAKVVWQNTIVKGGGTSYLMEIIAIDFSTRRRTGTMPRTFAKVNMEVTWLL